MTVTGTGRPQDVDPAFAGMLAMIPDLTVTADSLPGIRRLLEEMPAAARPDGLPAEEHVVDAENGVVVRVTRPPAGDAAERRPCVFTIHGGGYVLGGRADDDVRNAGWARDLGCVCVAVEYRLAPEHPYPAGLEDCCAGLAWLHDHAAELGVDPGRVGIAGLSAGGGLAAALALLARDRGGPPIAFQLLDSPMLDDRQATPSSRADWVPIWNPTSNRYGWEAYLGELYGREDVPGTAAPARATDLTGLPPALVVVGGCDGFCDEDVAYASRLNQAGVPTELHVYPGAPHGFTLLGDAPVARQATADIDGWLARRLGNL